MRTCHLFLLLVVVAIVGCGESTGAKLHGTVTLDGQPIESGTLQFMPVSGEGQPVGAEIANGSYEVKGVPVGKVKVTITALKETGETVNEGGRQWPKLASIVPPKYANGWEIDVAPGTQDQPIELTSVP